MVVPYSIKCYDYEKELEAEQNESVLKRRIILHNHVRDNRYLLEDFFNRQDAFNKRKR